VRKWTGAVESRAQNEPAMKGSDRMVKRSPSLWVFLLSTPYSLLFLLSSLVLAEEAAAPDLAKDVQRLKEQVAGFAKDLADRTPLKIGCVDTVRVFNELEEWIDAKAEISRLEDRRRTALRDLMDRVKNLEEKLKVLRPDSEDGQKATQELTDAKAQVRAQGRVFEDDLYRKLYDFNVAAHRKIVGEIRDYAAEAGLDLVLRVRDPMLEALDPNAPQQDRYFELNRRIENLHLLFARPSLDFTQAILERLNKKYAAEKARRPKPEAAPKPESKDEPKSEK
jgi:Skp family chaperone for outer membrane proteins